MALYIITGLLGAVGVGLGVFGWRVDGLLPDSESSMSARTESRADAVRWSAALGLVLGGPVWALTLSVAISWVAGGWGSTLLVMTLVEGLCAVGLAVFFSPGS